MIVNTSASNLTTAQWTYLVNQGTWDLNWNTTLNGNLTYTAYGDADSTTIPPPFPSIATGNA